MKCLKCKKISVCGCKSCISRRKMPRYRKTKLSNELGNDWEQCPYCKSKFHPDALLKGEWEEMKKNKKL